METLILRNLYFAVLLFVPSAFSDATTLEILEEDFSNTTEFNSTELFTDVLQEPINSSLPSFNTDTKFVLPAEECEALKTSNCYASVNRGGTRNCTLLFVFASCNWKATADEKIFMIKRVKKVNRDKPVRFALYNQSIITRDLFTPIKDNVVSLDLMSSFMLNVTMLRNVDTPNLITLFLGGLRNAQVSKEDFAGFPRLRILTFSACLITSIEEGSFDSLPNLRLLILEWRGIFTTFRSEESENVRRLHCDCRFGWLRRFLQSRPYLLKEREEGEIYQIGEMRSFAVNRTDIFIPVDCSKPNMDEYGPREQLDFSINDACPRRQ